jgi:hypothetical protein
LTYWLPLVLACDAGEGSPGPSTDGDSTTDTGEEAFGGETPKAGEDSGGEPTCVPESEDDIIQFDAQYENGTKYCPPESCPNAGGGCASPRFAAQTFASAADEDAARCILERLRDRVPGEYRYVETDGELYSYQTRLFVFESGRVVEEHSGSDEFTTTFIVGSGELELPSEFTDCLDRGPSSWAVCLRSAIQPGNGLTLADLSCPAG